MKSVSDASIVFLNDTANTERYTYGHTLSLHDALPIYCFESKYALCLYEKIERRIGLEYKQSEEFTIAELRGLLNVPEGKLERFADFNKYCLKVAQEEINKLCPFWVEFTPIKTGRKVERVSMRWRPKTMSGLREAQNLIDQHSIGRRA